MKQLGLQWVFNNGQTGKLEATPLVIDGIMYVSLIDNQVFALDARTGRQIWAYQRPSVQRGKRLLNGTVNRGVAVMGGRVYLATIDAYVVALDAQTGALLWETKAAETSQGYYFTLAPLAGERQGCGGRVGRRIRDSRGFIDAYDAATGKLAWRFQTIPGPGEPGHETLKDDPKTGGAAAWVTGTYDPALNLIYWGIRQPRPGLLWQRS